MEVAQASNLNTQTPSAAQSSNLFQNAAGFEIVGGQFVLGDVHNHGMNLLPSERHFSPDEVWSRVEIYCNELLRQKRGFPLYVPGPQINLPADYRRCGVEIGDIGRVTPEGVFDFYFNVYLPADHPINANRVPEDFRPLPRYTSDNVLQLECEPGDYVSSPSVFNSEPVTGEFPGGVFRFMCTGNTGAGLALPHGARVEKLENLEALRRYAAENAHSWYRYVNGPERGRGLENGTLCLVTGCEKTSSWGMASFQHRLQAQEGFQLCFEPTSGADSGFKYRWRGGTPARHKHADPPLTEGAPLNQTTFIHAFTISLGEGPWARLFGDIRIHQLAEYPGHSTKPGSGFVPYSSQGWWSFSFFGGGAAAGGRKHADRNSDHENVRMSEAAPTSKIIHPSRIINEHLVRAAPHASVVITHDDDWRDLLTEGGTQSAAQDASDLLRGISETFDVADEEGVLFLARRSEATPGSALMPLPPPVGRAEQQPFLRLDEDNTLQHESAMREQWMEVDRYNIHNPMRSDSPFARPPHSAHDMAIFPPSYNSSNSLVTWPPSRSPPLASPALQSSFSSTYHVALPDEFYYADPFEADIGTPFCLYPPLKAGGAGDELVTYYVSKVLNVQYLLIDSTYIRNIIVPSVLNHGASREAARLLASVHVQRLTCGPNLMALQYKDMQKRYEDLLQVLKKSRFTEDDALAALSIISSSLFDGGVGGWKAWLDVAYDYAMSAFSNRDPRDTLRSCPETTRFIIKATIWFDVLAAITTQEAPRLLEYIRKLFSPLESGLYDPMLPPSQELSMMSVMGCENIVVWVLAEASALSVWKREQLVRGCLSVPDLVERAQQLESQLDAPPPSSPFTYSQRDAERAQSAGIFRGATRVYLRSIVLGNFPYVREIAEAVNDTMALLRAPQMPSSVVRTTVFAFFVCGALTDDVRYRNEIANKLSLDVDDFTSAVGNNSSIKTLLQSIWSKRSQNKAARPVQWRDILWRSQILLI